MSQHHTKLIIDSAEYRLAKGKPVICCYARDLVGNHQVLTWRELQPYFYALPAPGKSEDLRSSISILKSEDASVVDVIPQERKVNEQERTVLKVIVNDPKAIAPLKDAVRGLTGIQDVFEYDIPFAQRFFMETGIVPGIVLSIVTEPEPDALELYPKQQIPVQRLLSWTALAESPPPSRMVAIDIESYFKPGEGPRPDRDPVLMIAVYGVSVQKVFTWKPLANAETWFDIAPDEKTMLHRFAAFVSTLDPAIVVGYFSDGYDWPYLEGRARALKVELPIGVDGSGLQLRRGTEKDVRITGRVHLDIFQFIKNVSSKSMQTDQLSLGAVAQELLGETKHAVDITALPKAWDADDVSLTTFAHYNLQDARLTLLLAQTLLPMIGQFVALIGQPIDEVIRMSFSRLVEWYIMGHAVRDHHIIPNKVRGAALDERSMERAQGAFVFEPVPGLYADICVYDYRSLYPSIIASHNISIGMMRCDCCKEDPAAQVPGRTGLWFCTKRKGFLSHIIEQIIKTRGRIKKQLKESPEDHMLQAASDCLKILANAFYGYIGFAQARWYAHDCVEGVTAWGRHHIKTVIETATNEGFKVIYSDTDSVFLQLGKRTIDDAHAFRDRINQSLPGLMELEFENYYPRGLFVAAKHEDIGAKKRYVLITKEGKLKIRGFEMVRRNVSPISRRVQQGVFEKVMRDEDIAGAVELVRSAVEGLQKGTIPILDCAITTKITRALDQYHSQGPHVAAALRRQARGERFEEGMLVSYVVIKGKGALRDRIRLPDEPDAAGYDPEYYIHNQVLPAVERVFQVLGINIEEMLSQSKQQGLSKFF